MSEQWTFYLLIFGAVFLAFQGISGLVRERREASRTAARFATIDFFAQNRAEVELLKKRSALTGQNGTIGKLNQLLLQSGSKLTLIRLALVYAGLAVGTYWLGSRWGSLIGLALGVGLPVLLIYIYLKRKRASRLAKFGEQLPDVLDVIVRSLKAGHPLPVSLSLVGREMPTPAGPEFTVVFDEISYGREVREALENLYSRVGHDDLQLLVTSIAIAHQTGGNLGEILARLSKLIRERFRMRRKIRALSAEGRAGGFLLSVVPFVVFGAISVLNPQYYAEFWGHPTQNMMIGVSLLLLTIGNFVIYKLVNFKV